LTDFNCKQNYKIDYKLQQHPINKRLGFLLKTLKLSARAFSESIGEKPTITQNYVGTRNSMPGADYLEKVLKQFDSINPGWLLMGEGEPFKDSSNSTTTQTNISGDRNNIASGKNDKGIHKNYGLSNCEKERDSLKAQLDKAQREIELLIGQVKMQETIIQGKDQLLEILRDSNNRTN
jgi:hypothetical protein